jgi:hypothetical protein
MPLDPRKTEQSLQSKFGFIPAPGRSTDHKWYELKLDDLPVITTKFSHSREPITDRIAGLIARQLRVRRSYLNGMIECTNAKEDYYQQVRVDPVPPWDVHF